MNSDIVIEITGLKSLSKFIGLEDTPLYYDNGKFFKVEDNKIIYTDIEWKDISGNIEDAPEIVDLIEDFVETISGETIQGYIEEHNSSESAHPYIQNIIHENYITLDTKIDDTKEELSQDISNLNDALNQEISDRETADNALSEDIQEEISARIDGDITLQNEIDKLNTNLQNEIDARIEGDTNLSNSLDELSNNLIQEVLDRQEQDGILQEQITSNYNTLDDKIDTEISNRTSADEELQGDIDNLSNTVTNNYTELNNKILNNTNNITANTNSITNINNKIPEQASISNQLADKNFVNSSIATNTANFIGTFNSVAELEAYSGVLTNNDYAFVATTDSVGNTLYDRYKWNGSEWLFEYELNNSSFTANQWASINSGITDTLTMQITTNQNTITNIQNNYVPNTRTVNGKALSSNITLNALDVNALANTTTINDLTTTAQQNAINSGATTTNIGQITTNQNAIGTLSSLTTTAKTDLVSAINELDSDKQDNITDLSTIRSGAELGATSIQPGDNISELTNNAGYTTNVGTVTSVNNVSPVNGNVSITIPTVNNATLTIQKNGTTVNTFTANASSNVTANITVPTDVSDLTNTTLANTNLGNLNETGNNRLHALKAYSDNGEVLTDQEGLADVKSYAHSTFDLSKFTIVGSPNITDDGIASGFSASNKISFISPNLGSVNSWSIHTKFNTGDLTLLPKWLNKNIFGGSSSYQWVVMNCVKKINNKYYIGAALGNSTGTEWQITQGDFYGKTEISSNTEYYAILDFTGNSYNLYLSTDGITYNLEATHNSTEKIYSSDNFSVYIGANRYGIGDWFTGSIDLKQFSITVDGVPVFSGNRTGIDTIKPDDYTVVGTPTISADGILSLSNSANNNYLSKPYSAFESLYTTKSWKLEFDGVFPIREGDSEHGDKVFSYVGRKVQNDSNGFPIFVGKANQNNFLFTILNVDVDGTPTRLSNYYDFRDYYGEKFHYELKYTGDTYETTVTVGNAVVFRDIQSNTNKLLASNSDFLMLPVNYVSSAYPTISGAKLDLNSVKVEVGDNLVYQPCLKIPYTESKTGSKVVNSIYRDRVNDMASQFGYANYYTLDEDNGNFTLPQVELYGLIGDKTLRDSYYNGVTYWELFSNRRLEQGGTCESGVEYTLPKPFADANYVLTIPYSSKTATSFIPSATGDFIAKGMGLL